MKTWKDVYELPLKIAIASHVWDNKDAFVFQFVASDEKLREKVIEVINGTREVKGRTSNFIYKDGFIQAEDTGAKLILIRGWGHLTGGGVTALNSSAEEASNIQRTFAEYILSRINV